MKTKSSFYRKFLPQVFTASFNTLNYSVLLCFLFLSFSTNAQPDCSTQAITIDCTCTKKAPCETCFTFTPATGATVDGWIWTVRNPLSGICEVSTEPRFCYNTCFAGQFEVEVTATYDNFQYICTTYKTFTPACPVNTCNPSGPPTEIPEVGVVYLEQWCEAHYFAFNTACTCLPYTYYVSYYTPVDTTIPCLQDPYYLKTDTLGPCECHKILVHTDDRAAPKLGEITVVATLPAGCCNSEYIKCLKYTPAPNGVVDTNKIKFCGNCDCDSPGCVPKSMKPVTANCSSNFSSNQSETESNELDLTKMAELNNIVEGKVIQRVEMYNLSGLLLYSSDYLFDDSYNSIDNLRSILSDHMIDGVNIVRLRYSDGSYKIIKMMGMGK